MAGWLNILLDGLMPPSCAGCRGVEDWWCRACHQRVKPISITYPGPHLDGIRAVTYYDEPLRSGLRALKYRHAKAVAPFLAQYLELSLRQIGLEKTVLVPVPLHRARLKERGHNQAELLARALARSMDVELTNDLVRTRKTASQTTLDKPHRAANVAGAFEWRGGSLAGQVVVIIDDVTTTGATLSACAVALRTAHPESVWGLAVAKKR